MLSRAGRARPGSPHLHQPVDPGPRRPHTVGL